MTSTEDKQFLMAQRKKDRLGSMVSVDKILNLTINVENLEKKRKKLGKKIRRR